MNTRDANDHHRAAVAGPGLSKRGRGTLRHPLDLPASVSECSNFRTRPRAFDRILLPQRFNDDISNGSRVIALTNKV